MYFSWRYMQILLYVMFSLEPYNFIGYASLLKLINDYAFLE